MHVDPAFGPGELFAAARRLLYGESPAAKPWPVWSAAVSAELGSVPPPLPWKGLCFGPDPLGAAAPPGAQAPGACGWFAEGGEALFHRGLTRDAAALRAWRAHAAITGDAKTRAALSAFFTKRINVLLDAWSCPDRMRKETAGLREHLAAERLPALFQAAYGAEALARAEKDLPPPRPAALAKPGSQVKSLAALGTAVTRGGESPAWAGTALCLGAASVSLPAFTAWFRFLAQPPLDSKAAIADLIAKATSFPDWEDMLLSPYHAAWASHALENRAAQGIPAGARRRPATVPAFKPMSAFSQLSQEDLRSVPVDIPSWELGGEPDLLAAWKDSRAAAERIRKGAKALRDRFCARLTAFGQSVAGLPKDIRASLDALDKPLPWTAKAEAELDLELYLNRAAAKAAKVGGAAAAAASAGENKADPVEKERKEKRFQDLSGRFKKL